MIPAQAELPPGLPAGALEALAPDEQDVFRLEFGAALAEGDVIGQATLRARQAVNMLHVIRGVEKALVAKVDGKRTLYVNRRLLNAGAIRAWAASQGIKSALPAGDMHVTVAFSKEPVDWSLLKPDLGALVIAPIACEVHQFPARNTPNGAFVLKFRSVTLQKRWQEFMDACASWDFPEYQPHITITYSVPEADVSAIEPYKGPLIFGPEEFAEVNDGWAGEIVEEPLNKRSIQRIRSRRMLEE